MFVLNTRKEVNRTERLGSPTDVTTTAIQVILQRMPEEQSYQQSSWKCFLLDIVFPSRMAVLREDKLLFCNCWKKTAQKCMKWANEFWHVFSDVSCC